MRLKLTSKTINLDGTFSVGCLLSVDTSRKCSYYLRLIYWPYHTVQYHCIKNQRMAGCRYFGVFIGTHPTRISCLSGCRLLISINPLFRCILSTSRRLELLLWSATMLSFNIWKLSTTTFPSSSGFSGQPHCSLFHYFCPLHHSSYHMSRISSHCGSPEKPCTPSVLRESIISYLVQYYLCDHFLMNCCLLLVACCLR